MHRQLERAGRHGFWSDGRAARRARREVQGDGPPPPSTHFVRVPALVENVCAGLYCGDI